MAGAVIMAMIGLFIYTITPFIVVKRLVFLEKNVPTRHVSSVQLKSLYHAQLVKLVTRRSNVAQSETRSTLVSPRIPRQVDH